MAPPVGAGVEPASQLDQPARPSLQISDPVDLLAVVPYLLGFHPSDSVVAVLVRSQQVVLTARIDLPGVVGVPGVAEGLAQLFAQHEAQELVLVAYGRDLDAREILAGLVAGLRRVSVCDALLVDGERWWSLLCTGECCPPQGRPYEIESHRLAAEAVYAGMSVRSGRVAIEALVDGPDQAEVVRLERVAAACRAELVRRPRAELSGLVDTSVAAAVDGVALDEAELVRLAVLVADLSRRDRAWASITRAEADEHVRLWAQVVAVAPPGLASAPLCLLGLAGWISGNGALQNCCVERVRKIDPGYSLGGLLDDISARALSPTLWDELQDELRAQLGLLAG